MKSFNALAFSTGLAAALAVWPSSILLAASPSQEPIDMSVVQLEPQQQNGISYLSGGIGLDESRAIQQAKGYNLHLTFSTGPANEYVPDVDVMIQNMQGHSVLALNQVGPIVYVNLPAGRYNVTATRNGQPEQSSVTLVGGTIRDVNAHWKDAK
ncbi:carboxypeptidase regulatory-like domain-containing protein [Pseudomonas purpurea]|uniref:carboxypeptidase regulatory-like domain-containing protein n=1 Tax=Pseudomonas purpurea TaxID=3136737 RepID=UPI0032665BAD